LSFKVFLQPISQGEEIMSEMPVTPEAPKKNNTPIIIAVVVVVLLCCCCLTVGLGWQFGDAIMKAITG
jgi:hypothetical protein